MAIPTAPTDEIFPVYTDLVDNWRAVDVHWLRNRTVQIFDDAGERSGVIAAPFPGMLSYLKTPKSLEFYHDTVWESVRYPNLVVSSDATTTTLKQQSAGNGVVLRSDGSVMVNVLIVNQPTAAGGVQLDNTGILVKVGTKSVKIATDATQLLIDSPVKVTGDIESSGTLRGATVTVTAVNASTVTLSTSITAPAANISGTVQAGTVHAGNAEMGVDTGVAVFRHLSSPANRLSYDNTGAAILKGASLALQGPLTVQDTSIVNGAMDFRAAPTLHTAGTTAAPVAALLVRSVAPVAGDNYPNGTIWAVV